MTTLIQINKLARTEQAVSLPESKNTLKEWKDKFNQDAPSHITYVIREVK